jgi:dUTPase
MPTKIALNKQQLLNMVELQDHFNHIVHPDWRSQNFDFFRAIMVEAVEALDHYGWKWWKPQPPNMPQVQLELVDIWHFLLSLHLQNSGGNYLATVDSLEGLRWENSLLMERDIRFNLERVVLTSCLNDCGHSMTETLGTLIEQTGLGWDGLYTQYMAKNILNKFRQAHGYKEGTYEKMWRGKEDNEVMLCVMQDDPNATPSQLYDRLKSMYDFCQVEKEKPYEQSR